MDSIIWLVAVVVFLGAEAATTALISIWFAVGAAVALIVSLFTASLPLQFVVFVVVSAVTLAIMVPTLVARRRNKKAPVTNGAALSVGKRGVVLQAILPGEIGRVRVDGLDWQARSGEALPQGTRCQVLSADGAILTVCAVPVEEPV